MKFLFKLLILQSICLFSYSQDGIDVFYETDSKGNYNFYCTNNNYCNYTVVVYFQEIINLRRRVQIPYRTEVSRGKNLLFTLEIGDPNKSSSFKYNYKYIKGCINPTIDHNFNYLLPVGLGKDTKPFELKYLKINERNPEPKDYYAVGFKVAVGDTIFAARRGIVTSLRDSTNLELSDYAYTSDDNFIEIYHKDCSFGHYQVFNQSLVRIGQEVEAGDPIAIAGGESYISGSHVRFWVNYNSEYKYSIKNKDGSNIKRYWAYVPLYFVTKESKNSMLNFESNYTCVKPESIITQEMSKRQLKKWKKNHNL